MQTRSQRNKDLREGELIVRRAISMGIVPDFKYGITLRQQTPKTQWALHILTVMSKGGLVPKEEDVKRVIFETKDLFEKPEVETAWTDLTEITSGFKNITK